MNKTSQLLLLLILSFNSYAGKVAYLPVYESDSIAPIYADSPKLRVIDIETQSILKTIDIGITFSAVFVSNDSQSIFVAAKYTNEIFKIDAKTLSIVRSWDNLPVSPEFLILSPDNQKLMFFERLNNKIYHIDLENDSITEVFSLSANITNVYFNKTLDNIILVSSSSASRRRITSIETASMSISNEFYVSTYQEAYLNDSGTTFYTSYDYPLASIHSYDVSSGTKNWEYEHPSDQHFQFFFEHDDLIIVSGADNTYKLNKVTGLFHSETALTPYYYAVKQKIQHLESQKILTINDPSVWCVRGCSIRGILSLSTYDFETGVSEKIYPHSTVRGGSYVSGRFIGNNLYQIPKVPLFSFLNLMILTSLFFALGLYMSRKQNHEIKL